VKIVDARSDDLPLWVAAKTPSGRPIASDEQPGESELEGRREPFQDQPEDGPVLDVRVAEIALDESAQVRPELDQERLVQPERMADAVDILGRGPDACDHPSRVGREDEGHEEGEDRDREQDDHRPAEPAQDVGTHSRSRSGSGG